MLRSVLTFAAWPGLLLTALPVVAACSGADAPGTVTATPTTDTGGPPLATDPNVPAVTDPNQPTLPLPGDTSQGTTPGGTSCLGSEVVAPKRLVRLSFNQIANSVRALLGDELADQVSTTYEIGAAEARTFPPLVSPREGATIIDGSLQRSDGIAQAAAQYVFDNFAAVTGCSAAPTEACGQEFVSQFTERAFRRPVSSDELGRLVAVYSGVLTAGGSVQEATQYGVYAALESPHFLYRTELGDAPLAAGALAPYEFANHLAFFLTDAPPDDLLLQAAASGQLATREQIATHVDRILQIESARVNLQTAIFAYFGIPTIDSVVIDPGLFPTFTEGLRNSMRRESQEFINYTLWNEPIQSLLTSRRALVNQGLADVYGVEFPAPGATLDADGFAIVELPENRAGLITQAGFLTARSRPDTASVVGRGLLLNATMLRGINPPFPEALQAVIDQAAVDLASLTERGRSEYRQTTPPCSVCHQGFDPFGVTLLNYDGLIIDRWLAVILRPARLWS